MPQIFAECSSQRDARILSFPCVSIVSTNAPRRHQPSSPVTMPPNPSTIQPAAEPERHLPTSAKLFPGRKTLTLNEVADALSICRDQVLGLIDEGLLDAVNIGTRQRAHWRISVEAFDAFVTKRSNV